MQTSQRGNVLFLILLAVILFAALSCAVTSWMRGGSKNASNESVSAQVSEILQWYTLLDNTITRMRLAGWAAEDLSFAHLHQRYDGSTTTTATNTRCTSTACQVFDPAGGGVAFRSFDKYAVAAPYNWQSGFSAPGYSDLIMMQWPSAGTSLNDVVLNIVAVKPEICAYLNSINGITAIPGTVGTWVPAVPVSGWDNAAYTIASNASLLIGKSDFASGLSGTGSAQYCSLFHLLIAR